MSAQRDTAKPRSSLRAPSLRLLLAPVGDGARRRLGSDVARLIGSVLLVVIFGILVGNRADTQIKIVDAVHPPPFGLSWVITVVWIVGTFGVLGLTVIVTVLHRRLEVLRDLLVGAGIALAICWGLQWAFGVTAGFPTSEKLAGVDLGYPTPVLAAAAAAALTMRPYLSRGLQRIIEVSILLALLSGLSHGAGLPLSLLASIVVAWGAAAAAHLIFGTPSGVPAAADVVGMLAELGLPGATLDPADHQIWGAARFHGANASGAALEVSVYGRDAAESQLWAKVFRSIVLRKDSRSFVLTRAQQIEHESYLTLLGSNAAPGHTSSVVAAGFAGPGRDGLVATLLPKGRRLMALRDAGEQPSAEAMASVASTLAALHEQGVSHGAIDLANVIIDGDAGSLASFDRATAFAEPEAMAADDAALLVVLAVSSSVDAAVSACSAAFGAEAMTAALPFLQEPALAEPLKEAIRRSHNKSVLKELREAGAKAAGVDVPELAPLQRMSATTIVLAVGTLIGAWALIGVLLKVADSFSTVKSASIPWVVATAVVGQLAYFGSAISTLGSITISVPYMPLVVLELSNTFSGLALGTPAVLATRVRFFQRHGMDTTVAVSSGVLVSTASWIVKGGLFLISLPFALGSLDLKSVTKGSSSSSGGHSTFVIVLLVIVAVGVLVGIVLSVPKWRGAIKQRLAPRFHEVLEHFKVLAGRPAKIVEIFGGQVVAQLVIALALGTALHAYHQSLPLSVIFVVLTLGSVLGGISPVPGGMGVVEAGMILGLKAAGVPDAEAVSAVFVQRLFTAYLPPIAGWFGLMWLRRKRYL